MLAIKLKIKSIKLSIMWNLFLSMIAAAIITFLVFLVFFATFQFISQEMYAELLERCYATTTAMVITSAVMLLVYLGCTIFIFTYRLNEITDYIKKISNKIHKLAQGDFEEKLTIESGNELGCLAEDINIMSDKIDLHIKNEKKWNEERYNIITNMSHDLKTPIMSIGGYIQLIKDKRYSDEKEFDSYCEIISKKSMELNNSINQLFELSKLNSDGFQLKKSNIRLKEFIEQVIISYLPLLEEKNLGFEILLAQDTYVEVDPLMMKRVFENIISNAIKYASGGKYLTVRADQQEERVEIHFINYGPVIPEDDIEHIFNRFYREKKNLIHEGNGLGLAIAKTIVELHGGKISVSSDEEKTDFRIILENI